MDFTINKYIELLIAIRLKEFHFVTFSEFLENPSFSIFSNSNICATQNSNNNSLLPAPQVVILRHDVDRMPLNSLQFAKIQSHFGINGTYYFRIIPNSYNEFIIKEIAELGHEIGYHYENMESCKGNVDKAFDEFCRNLETFRRITPIKTISMHGSPISSYDNRSIWDKYDYKTLGLIGEPYFDLNFNKIFYLTDTGRRWNGQAFNIRDKPSKKNPITNTTFLDIKFRNTNEIIESINDDKFPLQSMINFHPQRWQNKPLYWVKEFVNQNIKNIIKYTLLTLGK